MLESSHKHQDVAGALTASFLINRHHGPVCSLGENKTGKAEIWVYPAEAEWLIEKLQAWLLEVKLTEALQVVKPLENDEHVE